MNVRRRGEQRADRVVDLVVLHVEGVLESQVNSQNRPINHHQTRSNWARKSQATALLAGGYIQHGCELTAYFLMIWPLLHDIFTQNRCNLG